MNVQIFDRDIQESRLLNDKEIIYGFVLHRDGMHMALSNASFETVWTRNLLEEIGWRLEESVIIYEDNQTCIHLLSK